MREKFVRNQYVIFKRPAKTALVALVIRGGGCACRTVAAERTARRAGQANRALGLAAERMAIEPASPLGRWFIERAAPPVKAGMPWSSTTSTYPIPDIVRI